MKIKITICISILALIALAIAFWRHPIQPASSHSETSSHTMSGDVLPVGITNTSANISLPQANSNNANGIGVTNRSPAELRSLQIKQAIEGMNVPINFYGRVIDQNSNGLPEVKIAFRIMQPRADIDFAIPKNMPKLERATDADGYFSVEDISGSDLDIESVGKDGYRLSPKTQLGYRYGQSPVPFHPDPQNPVIIKMWKELDTKASLIKGSHVFGIDSGKTYTLDLVQGKKYEGQTAGDLKVSITRPSEVNSKDKYPWSYSIAAIHGGLIETDDEFMYLAPKSGYHTKFARQFDPTDSDWNLEVVKHFFIHTRDGQVYGRVQVQIYSVYNVHSAIEVNYAINPNGSRNLQP